MSKNKPLVGFDRYVEVQWMDQAACLVGEGKSISEINDDLDVYLMAYVGGETSRRKTKNILTACWCKSLSDEKAFKEAAVKMFKGVSGDEKVALHYGLSVMSYPYFLSLGKILGRLFKLQDEVTNAEFYQRVIESVGDRDSIRRASARYLQSLINWNILECGENSSVKLGHRFSIQSDDVVKWLYATMLFSSESPRMSVDEIISNPVWFPFDLSKNITSVIESPFMDVLHQGVGDTLVSLKG
ncbi:hypothetical protein KO507_13300 [Gilvimarinus agarilyticus]|uniref:hypothetical protein n=1 Tax=Gilvimarinus sp. 2_MG-2023 TaxID=3062666 RepID=UPI001C082C0C|nr:hypothetical protein [Gilvimarinus sp. 2_MG-2023]MBU2886744.1 hypothetical protein [Gilvimarinus agarilyticus]MDO6571409.1 hypothetical protein [Gilvimarinus sp. 2_MG-2023]